MKKRSKVGVAAAAGIAVAAALLAAPAQAAPAPYEHTSAMASVVEYGSTSTASLEGDQRRIIGAAKALAAGFKAATAPQAAGNVARLASILGFAAEVPEGSPAVEAAYFDR